MMNPEMMKMAMEQMNRMTPDQIAALQKQMAGMDPAAMQARSLHSIVGFSHACVFLAKAL
jgi:hypothetical protein